LSNIFIYVVKSAYKQKRNFSKYEPKLYNQVKPLGETLEIVNRMQNTIY